MWVGRIQSVEDQNRTQRKKKEVCTPFCFWPVCLSWDIDLFLPWTRIYTIAEPGFQGFPLRLNHPIGFLGSPACRQHIVGLPSLHNYMSQFLEWIFSCPCIFHWLCFSRELWLIQFLTCHVEPMTTNCFQGHQLSVWLTGSQCHSW